MQQRSEPYTLALSRRLAHGDESVRRVVPAQCPGRGRLVAVPLGRGPSLHGLRRGQALFVRPLLRYYARLRIPIKRKVAPLHEIDGDVMQQRSEPYTLALSRRLAHGDESVRRVVPAQCPGRGRLVAVPLGRGPSLHGLRRGQALFVRPLLRYYDPVRILIRVHVHRSAVAFMNRPGLPVRTRMRLPRFRAKNFSTCTRSPTARGSSHASHSPWDDVAFSSTEGDRHLGIRPVSQLNTWAVVSPVNASRRPSRDAAHHSGSGRMAGP